MLGFGSTVRKVKVDELMDSISANRARVNPDVMAKVAGNGPLSDLFFAMMKAKRQPNKDGAMRSVLCAAILLHQPGWDHLDETDVALAVVIGTGLSMAGSVESDPKRLVYEMLARTEHVDADDEDRSAYFADLSAKAIANMSHWTVSSEAP